MKISIIGIGQLGLSLALNLDSCGYKVVGYDINSNYINKLKNRKFNSSEPFIQELLKKHSVIFTDDVKIIDDTDLSFVMVNTPSLPNNNFDHSQIDIVLDKIKHYTGIIVICSTVMPFYCGTINNPNIVYNPQFVAQGSIINNQRNPDMILIGSENDEHVCVLKKIYKTLCEKEPNFRVMDTLSAEITKLALNCYITTKISFANMLGDVCKTVGAKCEDILSAIGSDSRVGSKNFSYGYGYGGPCFPRDNKAFTNFARQNGIEPFINIATEITNDAHLDQQIKLIEKGIVPDNIEFCNKRLVVNGVCYKQKTQILDESQQLKLAIRLSKEYQITIREKQKVVKQLIEKYGDTFEYEEL